jgi:DNA-binding PadR family transcriptional regulator
LETIRPGILKGGADPQRADEILGVQPIIQKIEDAIRSSDICVAEVSQDNPNVWLELGYALALDKPTVILCDRHIRDRLPFDVQHRPVVFYSTESKSGYDELETRVAAEVKNLVKVVASQAEQQPILQMGATDTGELKGYEVSVLAALLASWSSSPAGSSNWEIDRKLEKTGYTETQIAMGITRLMALGYIEQSAEEDRDGESYHAYRITPSGIRWLHNNENAIKPLQPKKRSGKQVATNDFGADFADDDIPF